MLQHRETLLLHPTGARRTAVFAGARTQDEMINSAFVTAYLLTGSAAAAEASVEEAIERWDPSSGAPALIQQAARTALSRRVEDLNDFLVPALLTRVMKLPGYMRRCFVLRHLVGLPAAATARLLCLADSDVDQFTSDAMRSLVSASTTKV